MHWTLRFLWMTKSGTSNDNSCDNSHASARLSVVAINHSITGCTTWIKTHSRLLRKRYASPPKSPEKVESLGPDGPLEASWPPLGPDDPLEAFWPLGVVGLPKMALMLESLVAATDKQKVHTGCHSRRNMSYIHRHLGFGCACQV